MNQVPSAHTRGRRPRWIILVAALLGSVTLVSLLSCQLRAAPTPSLASGSASATAEPRAEVTAAVGPAEAPRTHRERGLGEADGVVPDGVRVFDDDVPAVANLAPDLLSAVREAAADAKGDGITFYVNSGWRRRAYQKHLLRKAVKTYGSTSEAARWVATADNSPHVSGDAIDIGPSEASAWLARHGASYELCPIYRNEPWHYELRPDATVDGCPAMYADPTNDPRMEQ